MSRSLFNKLLEKVERGRLHWFILISLLMHHALLTLIFSIPQPPSGGEVRWNIIQVAELQETPVSAETSPPPEQVTVEAEPPHKKKALAEAVRDKKKKKPDTERKKEPLKKEEEEEKKKEKEERKAEMIEIPAIPMQGLHYVDVRSNESDKPPKQAKYFAPINSVVEEETRAERTNLDRDDGMSTPAEGKLLDDVRAGDSIENLAAHEIEEKKEVVQEKGNENKEGEETLISKTEVPSGSHREEGKVEAESQPATELSEKFAVKPAPLTPDSAPEVDLVKTESGEIIDAVTGAPVQSATKFFEDLKKNRKRSVGKKMEGEGAGLEMDVAWKDFEGVFGKKMEEERRAYEEAKRSRTKGGFTKRIAKVMSQLENFNPEVKPGRQTALNAAYHPFAEYITAFHRKLHPQWGDGYLYSLLSKPPSHPHNDMSLWVKLEIVVNEDGTIDKVTIVRSSGDLAYDVAAIDAVYGGQPYPPPPAIIKSFNGKVYLRWGFYRNESQCGVWNAEPYIIPAPPAPVAKPKQPPKEVQ